jgi:sugar O-acyltransferase (sialic acid O-acetyltransferase NeuD family)
LLAGAADGPTSGKRVVVFGDGQVATLAHFYLTHDSPHEVVAFTVDADRIKDASFLGQPVVSFQDVGALYPADRFSMFIAVGYPRVNKVREEKYERAKEMGYDLISYISTKSTIWPDAVIGDNCFVMEGNVIQPFVEIGNDVVIWAGCHIGHHTVIMDHCFVSSHTVIAGNVTVEPNCFFGVNSSIRNGITIARESVIGAGAVIMKDTEERGVYIAPAPQLLSMSSDRLPNL